MRLCEKKVCGKKSELQLEVRRNGSVILRLVILLLWVLLAKAQEHAATVQEEIQTFPTYDQGAPDANPQLTRSTATYFRTILIQFAESLSKRVHPPSGESSFWRTG